MTSDEAPAPKQYFINLGRNQSIKVGDTFVVLRMIPVTDSLVGEHRDFMRIVLGELQVQAVGDNASFGPMLNRVDSKDLPTMDSPWFMSGDTVQLKTNLPK